MDLTCVYKPLYSLRDFEEQIYTSAAPGLYGIDVQHPAPGFIKCGRRETIQLAMDQSHTSVYLLV
jgi:hypothetical protein